MNYLLPSTQELLKNLKKSHDVVILSYDSFVSLLATMEEDTDEKSREAKKEAEEDIRNGNLTPFKTIIDSL